MKMMRETNNSKRICSSSDHCRWHKESHDPVVGLVLFVITLLAHFGLERDSVPYAGTDAGAVFPRADSDWAETNLKAS